MELKPEAMTSMNGFEALMEKSIHKPESSTANEKNTVYHENIMSPLFSFS